MLSVKKIVAAAAAIFVMSALAISPAHAVNNDTISVYYDAPYVQGSYTTSSGGVQEDFNGTVGSCPSALAVGTLTGSCDVDAMGPYGGASTTGSAPTVQGTGSNYATTINSVNSMTITLANASKYFGLWWSAGSDGNTIKFYNNNELLITLTTATIISQFGDAPSPWPGASTFTALNGASYKKGNYFGNPRGYDNPPSRASTITSTEPFVYLHLFAGGNLSFNKVVLSGQGFEFDNLAVSAGPQTVDQRLVLAQTLYSNHVVTFNNNTGNGSMSNQIANSSTALTSNTFTKTGYSFTGWNTLSDGTGTPYTNQETYSFDQALSLFAQWQLTPYNVTYNTQGGSSVSGQTYTMGSTINLASPPTKTGYTFTGWYTAASGGSALGSTYSPPGTGNITLYAHWEVADYNVTYNSQGGSSVSGQTYTAGSTINLASPPTRTGYTFTGWYTAASGGSALGSTYSPPGTGNITLYAQWEVTPVAALALTGSKTLTPLWIASMLLMAGFAFVSASWAAKLKPVKNS